VSPIIIRYCVAAAFVALAASPAQSQASLESDNLAALLSGPRASTTVIVAPSERLELAPTTSTTALSSTIARRRVSRAETLMIVGGAALVAGLIVGDDAGTVLILAGAGIGGYGLYLHLSNPNASLRRF
jgi:hypothetical protein